MTNNFKNLSACLSALFLLSFCNAQTIPDYVPQDGLVAWYPFNGNADDESGNSNHGTILGAVLDDDRFMMPNSAYFLDGSSQITCGHNPELDVNDCTLAAWVYLSTTDTFYQTLISKYDVNFFGSYTLSISGDKAAAWFTMEDGGYIELLSNQALSVNQWHHLVATHSTTEGCKIYVDGQLDNSDDTQFELLQAPDDILRLGSQGEFLAVPLLEGSIDDLAIWNTVLSPEDIETLCADDPLSIEPSRVASEPLLYPNPSSGSFKIDSDQQFHTVIVTDISGKEIMRQSGGLNQDIRLEQSGTYNVTMISDNSIARKRLVVASNAE